MKIHKSINSFLEELQLPKTKLDSFYIVHYEEHNTDVNFSEYSYSHKFFELSFVLGYDAEVKVENFEENIVEHNLIFVSPNQKVTWKAQQKYRNAKSYLLLFSPEILSKENNDYTIFSKYPFFNRYTNSLYKLDKSQQEFILSCLVKMETEYQNIDQDSETVLSSYLSILLTYFKRKLNFNQNLFIQKSRKNQISYRFEQQLFSELSPKKTIKYYANKLNVSPVYLAECIKASTNKTFKEIVDEFTILKAKSLLKNNDLTIEYIANSLGFEERSSFTRFFKKQTNQLPSHFKNT